MTIQEIFSHSNTDGIISSDQNVINGFETILGLVQCTPDLSLQHCDDCIGGVIWEIGALCNGITRPSCNNIRYEIYRLFAITPSTPQLPAPPTSQASPGSPPPLTEGM